MHFISRLVTEFKQREVVAALIITSAFTLSIILIYPFLPPQIPLFYSLSISEQQLQARLSIFLLPILMGLSIIIHSIFNLILELDKTPRSIVRVSTLFILFLIGLVTVHTLQLSL